MLSHTTQRDLSAVRVRLSRLPSPRSSRALAQRIWAEKPACNRQTLSQVSLESAFASALTRLFPNSGENTAKDLVHIIKMPLKCFSTKISESRRAGENPLPGQLGWGERLGSLSLLPSRGPGRGGWGVIGICLGAERARLRGIVGNGARMATLGFFSLRFLPPIPQCEECSVHTFCKQAAGVSACYEAAAEKPIGETAKLRGKKNKSLLFCGGKLISGQERKERYA